MPREEVASPLPVLLGFLMLGPGHPYELNKLFRHDLGSVWRVGQSHIYAHLTRLAELGLAKGGTEAQDGRPNRIVYRVASGKKSFLAWLHEPSQHVRNIRLEFLARLYFFRRLELPGLPDLVAGQKALLQSRLESLAEAISSTEDEYGRMVIDFRRCEIKAIIGWLDRCQKPRRST
ncbi:MAG: PadR family transcriptional regulator, partial [Rectinemataceae bacterium]